MLGHSLLVWNGWGGIWACCTLRMLALWVQAAAGSCVLQLCVLVLGEKCLVQGSAGSLETLALTRLVCQLWESRGGSPCPPRRCWNPSTESEGPVVWRGWCEGIFWEAAQQRVKLSVSTEGGGDPEDPGLGRCPAVGYGGGCGEEPRPPGPSSRTVTQAQGSRETGLWVPEKQRAGFLPRVLECQRQTLARPAWHFLRGLSGGLSCPQNSLRCSARCWRGSASRALSFAEPEYSCV